MAIKMEIIIIMAMEIPKIWKYKGEKGKRGKRKKKRKYIAKNKENIQKGFFFIKNT